MVQHYFSQTPSGDFRTREIEVFLAGEPRSLVTAGGVFSPEHLDQGTSVLLRTLEQTQIDSPVGPILDLGCGWGPIALDAALRHPHREVWAVDINERSRELTQMNSKRLGLTNMRVAAPEEVPTKLQFSEIRSNPPIRVGKAALHGMLNLWLPRLALGGTAYLVVAKHLGANSLQSWISQTHTALTVDRFARAKGFHIIRAQRA